mmetsp:Transcript_14496/g.31511  ORF Transcript_14496/g.31511 Transcript_14496/m.31511 type:complete len:134 (+) Transcript_14496:70-471(+)
MASIAAKSQTSFAKATRSAVRPRVAARRAVKVCAKYGENSKYFDLQDLENTTGSWDMYGQDDKKRYPQMQETFFNQAADILTRREALRGFVALFGIGALTTFGYKGAADANLPITKAPKKTENGKGGTVRSRL